MNSQMSDTATEVEKPRSPAFIGRYLPIIDQALRAELLQYPAELCLTHRYHMGWSDESGTAIEAPQGKRLRPALVLLGTDAAGGDPKLALPIAVALEYIHNFSLIHDDVEDRDRFRHHRPTVWVIWGEALALIAGNSMLKMADRAPYALKHNGVSAERSFMIQRLIADTCLSLIEGQYMDIEFETRNDVTVDEYLTMIERKTGALIEAALCAGAMIVDNSSQNASLTAGLRKIGYELGRVFQIRDDMLGVWGSDDTGKPVGGDILNKKKALPAIHALTYSKGNDNRRIQEIYRKPELDYSDVEDVLDIMATAQTYEFCDSISNRHWSAAAEEIHKLSLENAISDELLQLGEFLIARES